MALVLAKKLNKMILIAAYSFFMAIPLIGIPFVLGFGLKSIHSALTRTKEKVNCLYPILGFVGFWLVVWLCQFLPLQIQFGDDGLGTVILIGFFYSIFWFVWMERKVNLFKPNNIE